MATEHTVVRSGKSKRKPFNSNVADYLLIIATFLGISIDGGQPCLKSPGFNPRALTAASGSRLQRFDLLIRSHHRTDNCFGLLRILFGHEVD
jgi:hypothetical protein